MARKINKQFNTRNGRVLIGFYDRALQEILNRIEGFDPEIETFDTLQSDVDSLLSQAEQVGIQFANVELPDQYAQGVQEADRLLSELGIGLAAADQKAHESIVRQIIKSTSVNFGKGVSAVRNGIDGAISQATIQQIQDTFAEGITRQESTRKAIEILRENGVQSIVDRGGKTWSLKTYVNMVSRTTQRVAYNQGIVNRSLELGIVVFKVSFSGTEHEACAVWEGELLSMNGEFDLPTIAIATEAGLFHPNCFHILQPDPEAQQTFEETHMFSHSEGPHSREKFFQGQE